MDPALLPLCPVGCLTGRRGVTQLGSKGSSGSSLQVLLQRLGLLSFHPFS